MYHDTACDAHIMHLYSIIVPFLNLASYKPCRGWSAEIDVSVDCLWFIWPQAITKKDSEPMEQRDFNNATLVHHAAAGGQVGKARFVRVPIFQDFLAHHV
jgi:hypothetical protein